MTALVRTPSPHATESLLGYVLRVSEANGYETPWHVLTHAGFTQGEMTTAGFPHEKLAKVLAKEDSELAPLAYCSILPDGKRDFRILGHSLGAALQLTPLRSAKPAFCPQCVLEKGFLDAFWDLSFVAACPVHRRTLVYKCLGCDCELSFFRPGLLTCKCGASLLGVPTQEVDSGIADLMFLLQEKLHGRVIAAGSNYSGFPLSELSQLPLRSLLWLLSNLGRFNLSAHGISGDADALKIAGNAAEVLANWPHGYYEFLRRLANQTKDGNEHIVGLRKRFEKFYSAMFKRREFSKAIHFLREEFVRFGLEEWGDGVVDKKLLRSEQDAKRFVSQNQLAEMVGVRPVTIRQWAKDGKIAIKEVSAGKKVRYVADLKELTLPKKSTGKVLETRLGAAYVGIPVSVLTALKKSGHYEVRHMAKHKQGYHEDDLNAFREELLKRSELRTDLERDASVLTLEYIMQELRFWSKTGKASFLVAYINGELLSVGRTSLNIQSIYFKKDDVEQFLIVCRESVSNGAIAQKEAARLIGCDPQAIPGLIDAGYLTAVAGPHRTRVTRSSSLAFLNEYLPLSRLAKEHKTSAARLWRLVNRAGISALTFLRKGGSPMLFIRVQDHEILMAYHVAQGC